MRDQLADKDARQILPIDRIEVLDFEWLPENKEQFEQIIAHSPPEILTGFGFVRYNSLPAGHYRQNQQEINSLIGDGFELFLFPAEWYRIIPDRFSLISIFAEVFPFEPGKTDASVRTGCLSYGIAVRVHS